MSDQDFFFDEEEQPKSAPKPAKGAPAKAAKGAPAAKTPAKRQRPEPQPASAADDQAPSMFDQNVTLAVAALMTVIGLLLGLIVGFVWGGAMDQPATPSASTSQTAPAASGTPSALTPEQLSGPLPAGHPAVSAAPTATTTP